MARVSTVLHVMLHSVSLAASWVTVRKLFSKIILLKIRSSWGFLLPTRMQCPNKTVPGFAETVWLDFFRPICIDKKISCVNREHGTATAPISDQTWETPTGTTKSPASAPNSHRSSVSKRTSTKDDACHRVIIVAYLIHYIVKLVLHTDMSLGIIAHKETRF